MNDKRLNLYYKTKAGRKALLQQYNKKNRQNLFLKVWNKVFAKKIAG